MRIAKACLLSLLLLLAACAPMPKLAMKSNALSSGQTIALIRVPAPSSYVILTPTSTRVLSTIGGMAVGLPIGSILSLRARSRGETLRTLVGKQIPGVQDALTDAVARALTAAGYVVEIKLGSWSVNGDGVDELQVARLDPGLERVLVVTPTLVGFGVNSVVGDFLPTVWISATLYGPDRSKPLYRGFYATGAEPTVGGWTYLALDNVGMADYDSIIAQPAASAEQLRKASYLVGRSIVNDLQRR
jgi:hypothetical protein